MEVIKFETIDDTPEALLEWLRDEIDRIKYPLSVDDDEITEGFMRGFAVAIDSVIGVIESQFEITARTFDGCGDADILTDEGPKAAPRRKKKWLKVSKEAA